MWSETIGYRDFRHPYLKRFFSSAAEIIPLTGKEDLLDLGCGVGEVALGFAPFVANLTGMDFEKPMLEETAKRAQAMGRKIRLVNSKVEEAPMHLGRFHLITIGNAHWFMHSPATFARIEDWLTPGGRILVAVRLQNPQGDEWPRVFAATREKWARGNRTLTKLTVDQFFQGSSFVPVKRFVVHGERKLELENLILRAQGYSSTTRAILGEEDANRMIAELRAVMAPYFRAGPIVEKHASMGHIYRRHQDS
jgi:cyclopropane fatty-acyl-phospholipid synthase-like methyltransferase